MSTSNKVITTYLVILTAFLLFVLWIVFRIFFVEPSPPLIEEIPSIGDSREYHVEDFTPYILETERDLYNLIEERGLLLKELSRIKASNISRGEGKEYTKVIYVDKPASLALIKGSYYRAESEGTLKEIKELSGSLSDYKLNFIYKIPLDQQLETPLLEYTYTVKTLIDVSLFETLDEERKLKSRFIRIWDLDKEGNRTNQFDIEKFETFSSYSENPKKFRLWIPHLDLGLQGICSPASVTTSIQATAGISFMGYGLTDNDLDWRFVRLGVDVGKDLGFSITPAQWNSGSILPLISNLWLGLFYQWGLENRHSIGLSLTGVI